MKILANDGISDSGKLLLENAGFKVDTNKIAQNELISVINKENYEIVLVRSATTIRKDIIDTCPSLKLIGRGGVGMDNIDVTYAKEKGIKVINTPSSSSQSVAELVIGQLFAISRFFQDSFKNIDNENFNDLKKKYSKGVELRGKTLGIIGFGRIGQSLASYALGLGMKVIAADQFLYKTNISIKIAGCDEIIIPIETTTDLDIIFRESDYISIHVPKQSDGAAVVSDNEFAKMKDGVRIVNAARGGVIDEIALIKALDSGKVAACAIDVFENEPTPNKILLSHPKIACTPHIGAATLEAQERISEELAELIIKEFSK
jgi:D-3-phosphoglycerate dehydrogenase